MDNNTEGLVVSRALPPSRWPSDIDAAALMGQAITWEYGTAFALSYMNEDGAGSHVALVFSLPINDDESKVLCIPIDMGQVQEIAMAMITALAGIHGKTLQQVIDEATARIIEGGEQADDGA